MSNLDTIMAYKQIRKYAVPYNKIQKQTNGGKKGLKDALKQFCESENAKRPRDKMRKYVIENIDFDFIVKHWPRENVLR